MNERDDSHKRLVDSGAADGDPLLAVDSGGMPAWSGWVRDPRYASGRLRAHRGDQVL